MSDQIKKAVDLFGEGVSQCKSKEEISELSQVLLTLSAKTIHGIEGKRFKKQFMHEAIKDNGMIVPQEISKH